MSKKYYDTDYYRLARLLTPTFLRGGLISAFLNAFMSPLRQLSAVFGNFRVETDYRLGHNSQICHLRKVLNDMFDPESRRITITGMQRPERTYLYLTTDLKPHYLGRLLIETPGESADTGIDFAVNLNGVVLKEGEAAMMRSLINYYKLASKRYKII
jgi:hypothetical protein